MPRAPRVAGSSSRAWFFTLNAREEQELPARWEALPQGATYMVYQKEKGTEGQREHYQGVVRFSQQVGMSTAKTRLGHDWIHLEVVRAEEAAQKYCMKEDTRLDGPWELGEKPQQVVRVDRARGLKRVATDGLEKAVLEQPGLVGQGINGLKYLDGVQSKRRRMERGDPVTKFVEPSILVLVGPPRMGKSRLAREIPTKGWWKRPSLKTDWWDGYAGEGTIIFDDFYGQIAYSELIDLLDGYPKQVQNKGGFAWLNNRTWILTSNKYPEEWYSSDTVKDQSALMDRLYGDPIEGKRFDTCVWSMVLKREVDSPYYGEPVERPRYVVIDSFEGEDPQEQYLAQCAELGFD